MDSNSSGTAQQCETRLRQAAVWLDAVRRAGLYDDLLARTEDLLEAQREHRANVTRGRIEYAHGIALDLERFLGADRDAAQYVANELVLGSIETAKFAALRQLGKQAQDKLRRGK